MISKETATDIALAYRELETAEKLLSEVKLAVEARNRQGEDIRDAFGRVQHGLQLGVPTGQNGHRLFNVPFALAAPVIEAHIAQQRAIISTLTERARIEISAPDVTLTGTVELSAFAVKLAEEMANG